MSRGRPVVPGVPAAGHLAPGSGAWHPGQVDGCTKCPPPPLPPGIRVDRDGRVWHDRTGRQPELLGQVDRHDYRTGRRTSRWRWVLEGGRTTLPRFTRQREAVLALLREAGYRTS